MRGNLANSVWIWVRFFLFSGKDMQKNERIFVEFPRFLACKSKDMVL